MRRWLPLLCIAAVSVGLYLLLAEYRASFAFLQIGLFAALIVVLVATNDKNGSMKGCITVLSFLFAPFFALLMALIEQLAIWSALDPAIGWAGNFRLPAMLAMAASAVAMVVAIVRRLKSREKLLVLTIIGDALLGLFIAAIIGGVASVAGFVWLGIGWGLNQAGL